MSQETCTVFSKLNNVLVFNHVYDDGTPYNLAFLPDYNFNVDARRFTHLKSHPVLKMYLDQGTITMVTDIKAKIEGQENGLNLVDTALKEGAVVTDNKVVESKAVIAYLPTKDRLLGYHGVTKVIANRILSAMPDGGWKSKADFLADPKVAAFEIDWSSENLKPS